MEIKKVLELVKKKKSEINTARKLYFYKPPKNPEITNKWIDGKLYTEKQQDEYIYTNWVKVLVNQKIDYSLSKPVKYDTDNMPIEFDIDNIFEKMSLNASLDKISWLQLIIKNGKLDWKINLEKEIIPVYDKDNKYLETVIKFWTEKIKDNEITFIQIWDTQKVIEITVKNEKIIDTVTKPHYLEKLKYQDTEEEINPKNFGFIPFIPLYNNKNKENDIDDIEILASVYNQISSGFVKNVKKFEELIYILKGYGGQDLNKFTEMLKKYNTIPIDTDGDLSHLEIKIPVEARNALLTLCKENIFILGRGVDPTFNFSGKDITNVFIKSFYYPLDVKCSDMEKQLRYFYRQLVIMINLYYKTNIDRDLKFSRNQIFNISEQIENCMKSVGIVSNETVIENHPFTVDKEIEMKRIENETLTLIKLQKDSMHDKNTL